ncbi:hypothetical protein C8F04DRAFT_954742 [Mycena alexandri]|uniref:Endoplasmic reticulum-based factor for assembly of V-ATPase-domain-containing protein n=1 Tax=Mycena alexandri TaxID=1745969 RepID=A0AAD6SX29_9AGAR|nr:hypothetical protein C8F04DRAFT_954742 [Mycena alexandri]
MSVLNISLETHVLEILTPLPPLLPPELATKLTPYISQPLPPTIPYPLLQSISQWSRTPAGEVALQSASLEPQSYSMVALLAGSVTSPERKFPAYIPEQSAEEAAALKTAERKAITSLVNALLSIIGSGFATYWAAGRTGWKNEWQVLCSLFVAAVVAISEAVLYLIWDSRRSNTRPRRKLKVSAKKRNEGEIEVIDASRIEHGIPHGLRQRTLKTSNSVETVS